MTRVGVLDTFQAGTSSFAFVHAEWYSHVLSARSSA